MLELERSRGGGGTRREECLCEHNNPKGLRPYLVKSANYGLKRARNGHIIARSRVLAQTCTSDGDGGFFGIITDGVILVEKEILQFKIYYHYA